MLACQSPPSVVSRSGKVKVLVPAEDAAAGVSVRYGGAGSGVTAPTGVTF